MRSSFRPHDCDSILWIQTRPELTNGFQAFKAAFNPKGVTSQNLVYCIYAFATTKVNDPLVGMIIIIGME